MGRGRAFSRPPGGGSGRDHQQARGIGLPAGAEPELVEVEVEGLPAVCGLGVVGEEGKIKAGQNRLLTGPSARLKSCFTFVGRWCVRNHWLDLLRMWRRSAVEEEKTVRGGRVVSPYTSGGDSISRLGTSKLIANFLQGKHQPQE